jgi:hypothetical protein
LGLSLFTLISTIIVLKIKKHDTQIIVAVTLLLLSFVLTTLLNFSDLLTQLFIQLFSLKLILAFSVNWFSSDKDETKAGNKTTTR